MVDVAQVADVLRLVAVPVLGWAAYRDVKVRRVPTRTWYPLVALGAVLLAVDAWDVLLSGSVASPYAHRLFLIRVGVSLGVVAPFSYLVWRMGGFGGADAKALIALAVLFPTFPTYVIGADPLVLPLPAGHTAIGVFSLTVLTNTVLLGASYPLLVTVRNLLARDFSTVMLFGRPVPAESIVRRHGSLLETTEGYTRRGLDVDALRMYLRWRGTTLDALRAEPEAFRDPQSVPEERTDPGDGAIATGGDALATDGGVVDADGTDRHPNGVAPDDEWGAAAFLADVGWGAYGTSPEDLREGLELLASRERVWYSPGIPFIVPMFGGLVLGLTLGDLLFLALTWLGVA